MSQEFSYQDVAEHNTKKDLYVVIHDKVYDITKFVDEHPYVPRPSPSTRMG
jgi:cytochrome b involved in lipid metabolism